MKASRSLFWISVAFIASGCKEPTLSTKVQIQAPCELAVLQGDTRCSSECSIREGENFSIQSSETCELKSVDGAICDEQFNCKAQSGAQVVATGSWRKFKITLQLEPTAGVVSFRAGDSVGSCPSTCVVMASAVESLRLTATPKPGYRFAAYSAPCGKSVECNFTVRSDVTVSADFTREDTRRVSTTVDGDGLVRAEALGISCRSDGGECSAEVLNGTSFVLTATPDTGNRFVRWQGTLCESASCQMQADTDIAVSAVFSRTRIVAISSSTPTDAGVLVSGKPYRLPARIEVDLGSRISLVPMLGADEMSTAWAGVQCDEPQHSQRCTFQVMQDVDARFAPRPLIRGMVGGWTGRLQFRDVTQAGDASAHLLYYFTSNSNISSPPLVTNLVGENVAFELFADGGLGPPARSFGGGYAHTLASTTVSVFALGSAPVQSRFSLGWTGFDAGTVEDAGNQLLAFELSPTALTGVRVWAHPGLAFESRTAMSITRANDVVLSTVSTQAGAVVRHFSRDFAQVLSSYSIPGRSEVWANEASVVALVESPSDGGAPLPGCSNPGFSRAGTLVAVDSTGLCNVSAPIQGAAITKAVVGRTKVQPSLGLIGSIDGGVFIAAQSLQSDLLPRWTSTPLLASPAMSRISGVISWGRSHVLLIAGTQPTSAGFVLFGDGSAVRCAAPGSWYSEVLVMLDANDGHVAWAHCLPSQSSEGISLQLERAFQVGETLALAYYRPALPMTNRLTLGAQSITAVPESPVILLLSPPVPP